MTAAHDPTPRIPDPAGPLHEGPGAASVPGGAPVVGGPVRVTRELMEAVYGRDGLVRVPADRLPATVTDPAARAFLTGIGLPSAPGAVVRPDEELAAGRPRSLADHVRAPAAGDAPADLPHRLSTAVVLGCYGPALFVLDGASGAVHALLPHRDARAEGRPAHRDLHSFARCLLAFGGRAMWLLADLMDAGTADWCRAHLPGFAELHPVRDEDGEPLLEEDLDEEERARFPDVDEVIAELTAELRRVEPEIVEHPVWQEVLRDFRYGH